MIAGRILVDYCIYLSAFPIDVNVIYYPCLKTIQLHHKYAKRLFTLFCLSVFIINKTHRVAQKRSRRKLNVKVCGSESAILSSLFRPLCSKMISQNQFKYLLSF